MPIQLASILVPRLGNTYALIEDKFVKGGFRVVNTLSDRDNIDTTTKKQGMFVHTLEDGKIWKLGSDLITWTEAPLQGPEGPIGATGPQGIQGEQGIPGPVGTSDDVVEGSTNLYFTNTRSLNALTMQAILDKLEYVPANKAGDTFSGNFVIAKNYTGTTAGRINAYSKSGNLLSDFAYPKPDGVWSDTSTNVPLFNLISNTGNYVLQVHKITSGNCVLVVTKWNGTNWATKNEYTLVVPSSNTITSVVFSPDDRYMFVATDESVTKIFTF